MAHVCDQPRPLAGVGCNARLGTSPQITRSLTYERAGLHQTGAAAPGPGTVHTADLAQPAAPYPVRDARRSDLEIRVPCVVLTKVRFIMNSWTRRITLFALQVCAARSAPAVAVSNWRVEVSPRVRHPSASRDRARALMVLAQLLGKRPPRRMLFVIRPST